MCLFHFKLCSRYATHANESPTDTNTLVALNIFCSRCRTLSGVYSAVSTHLVHTLHSEVAAVGIGFEALNVVRLWLVYFLRRSLALADSGFVQGRPREMLLCPWKFSVPHQMLDTYEAQMNETN